MEDLDGLKLVGGIMGIGIDIIEIDRIQSAMEKSDRFLPRLFTEREMAYFQSKGNKAQTVAGNFAAKEAIAKVLGSGIRHFNWVDIEVLRDEWGKPYVLLHEGAKRMAEEQGLSIIEVSISHCKSHAVANAIGLEK